MMPKTLDRSLQEAIARRLHPLQAKLGACSHHPTLIAVTKTRSLDEMRALYGLGQRHFGENRVEELTSKAAALAAECPDIHWHFIGNYQSNKLARLWPLPAPLTIHSLASLEHLQKLFKKWEASPRPWPCAYFLQVNTAREDEKSGFEVGAAELDKALATAAQWHAQLPQAGLQFAGLMTMARLRSDHQAEAARASFRELQDLARAGSQQYPHLNWATSMGMSQDFEQALEFGANYLRIGSLLFHD